MSPHGLPREADEADEAHEAENTKHRIPAQWAECGALHYEACCGLDVLSGEATNQLDQLSNEPTDHWNGGGDAHQ